MTAEDLVKWDASLVKESFLSPDSYRELEEETRVANGVGTGYALGLRLSSVRGHRKLEHAGEVSGFYTENIQLPDDKVAIVVLTNLEVPTCAAEIANSIVDLVLGRPADT
jgi:D-alanyl-D-alanine carboxypeptidase